MLPLNHQGHQKKSLQPALICRIPLTAKQAAYGTAY